MGTDSTLCGFVGDTGSQFYSIISFSDWNIPPLMPSKKSLPWCWLGACTIFPSSPPVPTCLTLNLNITDRHPNCCETLNAAARMSAVQDRSLSKTPTLGGVFWREVQHTPLSMHFRSQSGSSQRGKKSVPITSQMGFCAQWFTTRIFLGPVRCSVSQTGS